jgi:uncharacterized tellurite resistance protein B-like protein
MSFMRFLGGRPAAGGSPSRPLPIEAETEAVRSIVARLESMEPEKARLLAGMAYVLARAANADMVITDVETQAIENVLFESGLDQSQAVLVAEMAKLQERTAGGTSDYLVTREFREASNPEQRLALLRACFQVAAADGGITAMESASLDEIASELDIDRPDVTAVRAQFADKITARLGYRPAEQKATE